MVPRVDGMRRTEEGRGGDGKRETIRGVRVNIGCICGDCPYTRVHRATHTVRRTVQSAALEMSRDQITVQSWLATASQSRWSSNRIHRIPGCDKNTRQEGKMGSKRNTSVERSSHSNIHNNKTGEGRGLELTQPVSSYRLGPHLLLLHPRQR